MYNEFQLLLLLINFNKPRKTRSMSDTETRCYPRFRLLQQKSENHHLRPAPLFFLCMMTQISRGTKLAHSMTTCAPHMFQLSATCPHEISQATQKASNKGHSPHVHDSLHFRVYGTYTYPPRIFGKSPFFRKPLNARIPNHHSNMVCRKREEKVSPAWLP